jgi:hypothetical protein
VALRRWATQYQLRLLGPLVHTGSGLHHYLAPTGASNRAGPCDRRRITRIWQ